MAVERVTDWLLRRAPARRGTRRPSEPADLGTAFGLECSLDEAELPVMTASAVPPPAAGPLGVSWLTRWRDGRRRT